MNETSRAVTEFKQERLPYHPAIRERFGVDRAAWRALVEAVYPSAKSADSVVLALAYCKARKMDPFKRVVHIVPVWDSVRRQEVETVWPGIAEHRTTAFRTGLYAGCEPAAYGPDITRTFSDTIPARNGRQAEHVSFEMTFPEWCQLTIYRLVSGTRVAMPGPRVYWLETYSRRGRTVLPNDRWQRSPRQMIEKCAEAAGLRRAFPEELGDEWTAEEAGGLHAGRDVGLADEAPARPTSADAAAEPTIQAGDDRTVARPGPFDLETLDGEIRTIVSPGEWMDELRRLLHHPQATAADVDQLWDRNAETARAIVEAGLLDLTDDFGRLDAEVRRRIAELEAATAPPAGPQPGRPAAGGDGGGGGDGGCPAEPPGSRHDIVWTDENGEVATMSGEPLLADLWWQQFRAFAADPAFEPAKLLRDNLGAFGEVMAELPAKVAEEMDAWRAGIMRAQAQAGGKKGGGR